MTTEKSFLQKSLEAALNFYGSRAVEQALDFIAGLSEEDMKEWTAHLDDSYKAKAYAVWRAARDSTPTLRNA